MTERDLRSILSCNIKKFRVLRKLTQSEFAERINISIPFLSDIENGKKWISPATLAKIADALNINAYELFKPESILPDNAVNIIEKYTLEIYKDFGKTLENIQNKYIKQINSNKK